MKSTKLNSRNDIPLSGRPSKLIEKQRQELKRIPVKGALSCDYPTDFWALKRVTEVFEIEFGVIYNITHIWRVLRDEGFSARISLLRAKEISEEFNQVWVKIEWAEIVLQARIGSATIFFLDKRAVRSSPNTPRAWAPRGSRQVIKTKERQETLYLIYLLSVDGELNIRVHDVNITAINVITFHHYQLREIPSKVLLIWDSGAIHRRKDVKQFL